MNKKHKLLHINNEYITSKLEIIYEEDIQRIVEERNNLQSKIDKAIEYINEEYDVEPKELYGLVSADELLDILKVEE